ncbi:MAG: TRAP transporter large permease subunit [Spirochaetaceae bacterium]|jgi:C4-dicarboxylate transporter DctM subunit|nr:TRAP transporter large permease subunit [Spirochaetaceae bacterium]
MEKANTGVWGKISGALQFFEDNASALFLTVSVLTMTYEVLARYFIHTSIYWATEWTPFLVTWGMLLGNAVLIRRKGHISITILQNALKKGSDKCLLDIYIALINVSFSALFIVSSFHMVTDAAVKGTLSESLMQTPMMFPYSMMVIAGILMIIRSIEKIFEAATALSREAGWYRSILLPILLLLTLGVVLMVSFVSNALVVMAALLVLFLLMGVPITYSLGLSTIIAIIGFKIIGINGLASKMFWSINKYSLLAIPFFVISGNIMAKGNLGKYLLDFASSGLRAIHGGFAISIMFAAIVFAAISGASAASAAALAVMALPIMVQKGYPKEFGAGLIATGGTLAIIIPPSSMMILYGATAEVSITDMFKAGILPGLSVAVILIIYIYIVSKARGYGEAKEAFSLVEVWHSFKKAIWALIMPVAILGSIYSGVCTPTEAAAVSVIYAFVVCVFVYKDVDIKQFWGIIHDSVRTSAFILAITMTASLFGFLITMEQFPQMILDLVVRSNIDRVGMLLLINAVIFLLGFFMSPGAIILIVVPIVLPVAKRLGIDPIHLGIIITVNLEIALLTPPVGANLYVLSSVGGMAVQQVIKGVMPFVLIMLVALLVITFVPQITLSIF